LKFWARQADFFLRGGIGVFTGVFWEKAGFVVVFLW
jgi:hypothetical protein